jgi:hypothetical protein
MLKLGLALNRDHKINSVIPNTYAIDYITAVNAAGGTFTALQEAAIYTFFDEMTGNGTINTTYDFMLNMFRGYLYLGGTSATCLIDIVTATSIGSFNGGGTINANGFLGNATNAYQNTLVVDSNLSSNDIGAFIRVGNNYATGTKQQFYGGSGTGTIGLGLLINYAFGFNMTYATASFRQNGIAAVASTKGSYAVRRTGTTQSLDKNGINLNTAGVYTYQATGTTISINAANYAGSNTDYADGLVQSFYIGNFFTTAQSLMLESIDANLQTAFSRL